METDFRALKRSLAYRERVHVRRAWPEQVPALPQPRRASFIMLNMILMPWFSSPSRYPMQLSFSPKLRAQVAEAVNAHLLFDSGGDNVVVHQIPVFDPFLGNDEDADPFGSRRALLPLLARTMWMMFSVRSWSPAEMKILLPVME